MLATFTRLTLRALDRAASLLPRKKKVPEHLIIGKRGEETAYFYLRGLGYVFVARNYRSPNSRSEIDLIGWDKDVLCFVEVKTRTSRDVKSAEAAVDSSKQRDLSIVAQEFLRKLKAHAPCRFDVISIYFENQARPEIELFKDAFRLSRGNRA